MQFVSGGHEQCKLMCKQVRKKKGYGGNHRHAPSKGFSSVETCLLVDVNQALPWVFHALAEMRFFPLFMSTRKNMSAFTPFFCNILLKDLTPLHVKIMSNTNLSSVCRRKLKLSTYLHTLSYNHILSFLNTRSQFV